MKGHAMKFKLLSQHYINDMLLEPDTIVGDGGVVPFRDAKGNALPPTGEMEPLDDEARELLSGVTVFANADMVNAMTDIAASDTSLKPKK